MCVVEEWVARACPCELMQYEWANFLKELELPCRPSIKLEKCILSKSCKVKANKEHWQASGTRRKVIESRFFSR
jgi:formate hydrogenlyase subunit 6/NADH:ubiquinone oxidoreductase subunit I